MVKMIKGLTEIASGKVDTAKFPRQLKRKKVLLPLPFCQVALDRASIAGRGCVMVESVMDYFNPKWTSDWWQTFFDEASQAKELSTEPRYAFYNASHVEVLDSQDSSLQAVSQVYEDLCPKAAVDSCAPKYPMSILHHGVPSEKEIDFDTSLFRSLFNLTEYHTGKTLLSMFSYSVDCLKRLVPSSSTLLECVSERVKKASGYEKRITQIIGQGRKPQLRGVAEQEMIALAQDMRASSQSLLDGGSLLFKGGCGSSNKQMRDLMHGAFVNLQSSSIDTDFQGLELAALAKKGYAEAIEKFGPENKWDQHEVSRWLIDEFLPGNLKDFETTFRTTYASLTKDLPITDKRKAHLIMQGWKNGETKELEKHLKERLLHEIQNAYGHLLSDGVFERFFDDCNENIIEAVKGACDYLSDEWQSGLSTFLEKGTFEGVPDHVKTWLPEKFSEEFAKTVHQGLQKILTDDVFPGSSSKDFLQNIYKASAQSGLENAFRSAFSELMQTGLVDNGFEKYNSDLSGLLNQMPPEVRSAFGQIGIGSPETQIWYALSNEAGSYKLKVFSCPDGSGKVEELSYSFSDTTKLSQAFFLQLIKFRVKPRTSEDVSYSLDDVFTFLNQHFGELGSSIPHMPTDKDNAFRQFTSAQKLLFAVMEDQLGLDVPKDYLYAIRQQALIDMNAKVKKDPSDHTYLQEGAESLAKEAKIHGTPEEIKKAFETFWQVSANAPENEGQVESSTSVLINNTIQKKLRTIMASLGLSVEHVKLFRRIAQGAFGADMGPVVDSFVQELLGNPYRLSKVSEDDKIDLGAKIGGVESLYTVHSIMSAYVRSRIQETGSVCLKMALQVVRLFLWTIKVTLGTLIPITLKITPQMIKDLVYLVFMFVLSVTLPILAKALVWMFMKPERIEELRQMAFEYQRVYTRTGGLDFSLDSKGKHRLHLFNWFREHEDIEVLRTNNDRSAIRQFRFKSLNLVFNINAQDGRAYIDESQRDENKGKKFDNFFIARDQKLPKGMNAFSKFLVLENAAGEKKVVLAEDSLDATVSSNLGIAITKQNASPLLSRVFQSWADNLFPSHRKETAYFVYDYNTEEGKLESNNPSAVSYLLFYHVTKGEIKQAERVLNQLSVIAEQNGQLPETLEPLMRRMHVYCMLQPDRRTLFLGLKLAALREKLPLLGAKRKKERLAPSGDEAAWQWLDALGLQASMLRYQDMKHRMLSLPLSDAEEYRVLNGLERRFDELRKEFIDPSVEDISLGDLAAKTMPTWASAVASKAWGFAPAWAHTKKDNIESGLKSIYDNSKSKISKQLMAPALQKRLAELGKIDYQPLDSVQTRAAFSWIPHFVANSQSDPFATNPYLCSLPFETGEDLPFTTHLDSAFGLKTLLNLRHLIAMPVGKIPAAISPKRHISITDLTPKDLRLFFFDYYRLVRNEGGSQEQQKIFKKTLTDIPNNDPIALLLKQAMLAPNDFPTATTLSQALLLNTIKLDDLPKQSASSAPKILTKSNLRRHFFKYYAIAHGDGSGDEFKAKRAVFIEQIALIKRIDPITQLLQSVAQSHKRNYPTVDELKAAYEAPKVNLEDLLKQMRKSIIENKDIRAVPCAAPQMTPSCIKTHFLDYYRLALDKSKTATHQELDKVVGRFDPMSNFLLSSLKIVANGQGSPPPIKEMEKAFILASQGSDSSLRSALKALKKTCQEPYHQAEFEKRTSCFPKFTAGKPENLQAHKGLMTPDLIKDNMLAAFRLAKGKGDPEVVKAFRMQIGCLVDASQDTKLNFFITFLSLVAQNPDNYPRYYNRTECIKIAKQELKAAGSIDIARNLPASLLASPMPTQGTNSWFGFGKITGIAKGAFSLLNAARSPDLKQLGQTVAAQAGKLAAWYTNTPVPLNSVLFAAEHLSKTPNTATQVPVVPQDIDVKGSGFTHSDKTINKIMRIDSAMNQDMFNLLSDHSYQTDDGRCAFKSEKDYFQVRKGLATRKKHLRTLMNDEMKKILNLANYTPVDFTRFSDRETIVTQDELLKLFVAGDEEALIKRTGLLPYQARKIISMLLAYHQLQSQAEFLTEWQNSLTGISDILAHRFEQKDYTLARPFDWMVISVDQLREYFIRASLHNNRMVFKPARLAKKELSACHALYPGLVSRRWKKEPLTRRLLANSGLSQ